MNSITFISIAFFAIFATSSALQCSPVMCFMACQYGFDVDEQGCQICSCRTSPETCVDPIFGYNCGSIDNRECPSSHRCQLSFGGYYGQCCLKLTGTTTARATTATGTTPHPTTGTIRSTTRRFFKRFATGSTAPGTDASDSPAATTGSSFTHGASDSPAATTHSSFTTDASHHQGTTTGN